MSILEQLSSSTGARGEQLEIALAAQLATHPDPQAVADLVDGLTRGPDRLRGDCVKVLYELGKLNPDAISAYVQQFLSLLRQKNNRLVWGGMIALATIAPRVPQFIFTASDEILRVMERGSVITRDAGVAALADEGVGLLLTVDCGVSDFEAVAAALKELDSVTTVGGPVPVDENGDMRAKPRLFSMKSGRWERIEAGPEEGAEGGR